MFLNQTRVPIYPISLTLVKQIGHTIITIRVIYLNDVPDKRCYTLRTILLYFAVDDKMYIMVNDKGVLNWEMDLL